jgi:hypothetical protein
MKAATLIGSALFALTAIAFALLFAQALGALPVQHTWALWLMSLTTLSLGALTFAFGSPHSESAPAFRLSGVVLTGAALAAMATQLAGYAGVISIAGSLWVFMLVAFLAGVTLWIAGAGLARMNVVDQ